MKRIGVVVFPGSNCDRDCLWAVREAGAEAVEIWHGQGGFDELDAVILPGGFSYGDALRAGALAARSPVVAELRAFAAAGKPVVGICNGFQMLVETGLLPGALMRNRQLRFLHGDVHLQVSRTDTVVTSSYQEGQILRFPIAHKEGCFWAPSEQLEALEAAGAVCFRYVDAEGRATEAANRNGSLAAIAGLADSSGRIVGLMPHPERAYDALLGGVDGRPFFASLVEAA